MQLAGLHAPARVITQSSWSIGQNRILAHRPHYPLFQTNKSPAAVTVRHATHGAQGRANGPKNGVGKRLGAKKTGDQYVIPGNIIFRQRGTKWFPGANVGMGRDHTLFAQEHGFVKYYRDPALHPKRQYIGVVFERTQTLPFALNMPRKRRLGMLAVPRPTTGPSAFVEPDIENQLSTPVDPAGLGLSLAEAAKQRGTSIRAMRETRRRIKTGRISSTELSLRPDYSHRESNYSIGKSADRAGVKVTLFKPNDRFTAWRKRNEKKVRAAEKRALGRKKGSSTKKVKSRS